MPGLVNLGKPRSPLRASRTVSGVKNATLRAGAGGPQPISAYKVQKSSQAQTYSASQAGIFSVPTRLLSIEVVSVSGGSATVWANSANSGTAIVTAINSVGKITIPGGYLSFLGLSIAITGTISVRLEWETYTDGMADDVYLDTVGVENYSTVVVTASRAGIRTSPCDVAGFICNSSGGGSLILYDNQGNSGDQIYSGTPAANTVVDLSAMVENTGLSAAVTGTLSLAVQVR